MSRPSRVPLYLGVVLVAAGWVVLGVAWYQTGRQDLETGQIPYVLSGGFGAWALIVLGGASIVLDFIRQAEWRAQDRLDDLHAVLEAIARSLERPGRPSVPAERRYDQVAEGRPRRRRGGREHGGVPPGS